MVVLRGQLKPFPFLECQCPGGTVTCRDSLPSEKNSSINLILLVPFLKLLPFSKHFIQLNMYNGKIDFAFFFFQVRGG